MRKLQLLMSALVPTLLAQSALAQQEPTYDRVDFSVSAEREVQNDTLIAVVFSEVENNDQSDAANAVNQDIDWAASQARGVEGVDLQTLRYSTRPVYAPNSRRIVGWIARQSLRLESRDAESLSTLLGDLQTRVAIESLTQELSREARAALEDELIAEAIESFRRRAALVTAEMGRDDYRLMFLDINSGNIAPRMQATMEMRGMNVSDFAAPAIEAGIQILSVNARGAIEISEAE